MSPRTAEQNESIREERRRQILDAALTVFSQKGFDRANVSDVAAEAGVSQGTIYYYFDSKEALYQQLLEQAFAVISEPFLAIVDDPALSTVDRLLKGFAAASAVFLANEDKYRLLFTLWPQQGLFNSEDDGDRYLDQVYRERIFVPIRKLIIEAMEAGEIAPGDVDALTTALAALADGLMLYYLVWPESHLNESQTKEILLRILQPVKILKSDE